MKVYNVSGMFNGCNYVRQFLPQIMNGWDGDMNSMFSIKSDEERAKYALQADVIVYHRPDQAEKYDQALIFKRMGKKIVMDNDDTYLKAGGALSTFGKEFVKEMNENLYKFASIADMITVSTEQLKKEYESVNKNVHVLENCIYPLHVPKNKVNDTGKIRIGIIGSAMISNDWLHIKSVIESIAKDDRFQLVIFGLVNKADRPDRKLLKKVMARELKHLDNFDNLEWHSAVPMNMYFKKLSELSLDIMLIPREQTYFNECKSNLKFLEASALKVPCIVQKFKNGNGPYDKLPDNTCVKCETEEDFATAIEMMADKNMRETIANTAYEYVMKNYNIKTNFLKWNETYKLMFK